MRCRKTTAGIVATASILLLSGCAASGHTRAAGETGLQCPRGYTVTCEVRKIGRIHHGTFKKNYDSCSCVSDSMRSQTVPTIPRLSQ